MAAYRSEDSVLKVAAVGILRDLLVRHSYDARYQSQEAHHRIATMYLPLFSEIVAEARSLAVLPHVDVGRKELLSLLLSLLGMCMYIYTYIY
jgi:hypothetical protein